MFRIIIEESMPGHDDVVKRYEQNVDALDLKAVMAAVNKVPRKPRVRKTKEDAI